MKKTLKEVQSRFFWVNIIEDVHDWCQQLTTRATRAPMQQYSRRSQSTLLHHVLKPTKGTSISLWHWITSSNLHCSQHTRQNLLLWVLLEINAEQGIQFDSTLFQDVCKMPRTTLLHLQADIMVQ